MERRDIRPADRALAERLPLSLPFAPPPMGPSLLVSNLPLEATALAADRSAGMPPYPLGSKSPPALDAGQPGQLALPPELAGRSPPPALGTFTG